MATILEPRNRLRIGIIDPMLKLCAKTEEDLTYPAVIMAGKLLKR